jgi:hypothetical protein
MSSVQKFIAVEGQGPFGADKRIQFEIPKSAGVLDLSKANLIGKIQIKSALVRVADCQAAYTLDDGIVDLIRECRVQTGSGQVLDELQNVNVLACAKNSFLNDDGTLSGRRVVELARRDLLTRSQTTNTDSSYPQLKFTMPLSKTSLGVFDIDQFPAFSEGLRTEFLLDEASVPLSQHLVDRQYSCADFGGANTATVTLAEVCHAPYFTPGEEVVVSWDQGGNFKYEATTIRSIDYSGKFAVLTIAALSNTGADTQVTVQHAAWAPTQSASATTLDFEGRYEESPFYVGMALEVYTTDTGTAEIRTDLKVTEVDTAGAPAGSFRITFTPAIAGTNRDSPFIRQIPASMPTWELTDLAMEIPTSPADPAMMKQLTRSSMQFPVKTFINIREMLQPALFSELTIPVTDFMAAARAIMSIPVDMASTGAEGRLRGCRDFFRRYQFLIDGRSSPLQPVNTSVSIAPYHLSMIAEAFSQCGEEIRAIAPDYMIWAKPLSALGASSDLRGKRVALRFERSTVTGAVGLMVNHFICADKMITLGARA